MQVDSREAMSGRGDTVPQGLLHAAQSNSKTINPSDTRVFHPAKRDNYNFVAQKNAPNNANSQEKMRRNQSREYCPMIIKSSNNKQQRPEAGKGARPQ